MSVTISQSTIDEAKASVDERDREYAAAMAARQEILARSMADDETMTSLAKDVEDFFNRKHQSSRRESIESIETILEALRSAYLLGVQAGRLR